MEEVLLRTSLVPLASPSFQTAKSTHHPHKIDDEPRECKTGGGAHFAFFLGFDNLHTTPPKRPPDEKALLWGWCVVGGPLSFVLRFIGVEAEVLLDYQGRAVITSIGLWNLRPVIFGADLWRAGLGHGEVRVHRGTGVSRRVRRTTWESSLQNWELQIPCFEEFFWGRNTLGLVPASLPHALGYACTFYAPLPLPQRTGL